MTGDDITMLNVGGTRVGMTGLGAVFESFAAEGAAPSDELGEELVRAASSGNYIPDSARSEYAGALLAEYRRHLGEQVPDGPGPLTVRILGAGCPNCERLARNVMAALTRSGTAADVEHVRDPARIGGYGVLGTPALMIDGEVRAAGRVPSVDEIEEMLAR